MKQLQLIFLEKDQNSLSAEFNNDLVYLYFTVNISFQWGNQNQRKPTKNQKHKMKLKKLTMYQPQGFLCRFINLKIIENVSQFLWFCTSFSIGHLQSKLCYSIRYLLEQFVLLLPLLCQSVCRLLNQHLVFIYVQGCSWNKDRLFLWGVLCDLDFGQEEYMNSCNISCF